MAGTATATAAAVAAAAMVPPMIHFFASRILSFLS